MKILIYGNARTRSTYLIDILAKHYDCPNLFEPYHRKITDKLDKTLNFYERDKKYELYLQETKKVTEHLKKLPKFAVKLFPDALYNFYKYPTDTNKYKDIKKSDCLPFIETFNIQMYDLIFATTRNNTTDWLCSFLTAQREDMFLFKNEKEARFYAPRNTKLKYTKSFMEGMAFSNIFFEINFKVLKKFYPNIIRLDYDEIPSYVQDNFSGIKTSLIDTKYNYKKLITNYSQIEKDFEQARIDIEEEKIIKLLSE